MKKTIAIILAACLFLLSMTACSSSTASSTTAAASSKPAASAAASASTASASASTSSAAASTSSAAGSEGKKLKFGFTEWISCEFFDSVYDGFMSVVDEHGDTEVIHSEGKADATYQQSVVEDFIAQGCDVVFYNPVDSAASTVAVEAMKDAGIIVVNFDTQVADISKVDAFVGTDNYTAGKEAGEAMVADFPDGGKVAVLDYPANTAAVDRENGFLDAIKDSGLEVVATLDSQGLTETATDQMDDILQAHPDLDAVFAINDDGGLGAYAAITAAGMQTKIYSVNGSPDAKAKIAEGGIFVCTAAQSTINMGKQSAEIAYKILDGETVDHETKIAPIAITKANISQYGTDGWQ